MSDGGGGLRIRDVVERTGISEANLRAWEARHGFPQPRRLPSGHRRYSEDDVRRLLAVLRLRTAGTPVGIAVERVLAERERRPRAIFAALRRQRPDLEVRVLPKPVLVAISQAIEDEATRSNEELLLFGAFQRVRHYHASRARWRELSRGTIATIVFADFAGVRRPATGPTEVPLAEADPLMREWAVVAEGSASFACMVGWEPPRERPSADRARRFETLWSFDPEVVRSASRICCDLAAEPLGAEVAPIAERLAGPPQRRPDELRSAESLTNRMIGYLARSSGVEGAGR